MRDRIPGNALTTYRALFLARRDSGPFFVDSALSKAVGEFTIAVVHTWCVQTLSERLRNSRFERGTRCIELGLGGWNLLAKRSRASSATD